MLLREPQEEKAEINLSISKQVGASSGNCCYLIKYAQSWRGFLIEAVMLKQLLEPAA